MPVGSGWLERQASQQPDEVGGPDEAAYEEPQMDGIGRELVERGVHRDPVAQIHLGPCVIVPSRIPGRADEPGDRPRREAESTRHGDEQYGVLVRVATTMLQHAGSVTDAGSVLPAHLGRYPV